MPLTPATREFLGYLQKNPAVRACIAAPTNATVLYAGSFFRPIWKELEDLKRARPDLASKKMLSEVLAGIRPTDAPYPNLLVWAQAIDPLEPWRENGFIVWRALSGIYASNARGAVSFCIGSGITRASSIFAATELPVLLRNPHVDHVTKQVLEYYQRCIRQGLSSVNFGYIAR